MVASICAAPPPAPPVTLVPLADEPPPPPPMSLTWVEMIPAGTTKFAPLNQLLVEHGPVAPLMVWV
jgi:hypothetical protein